MDSILRSGLLAGGPSDKPGRRQHCYFSIADPRHACGRPKPNGKEVVSGVTSRPYKMHKELDALYLIDVKRANEFGTQFFQTPSYAVLCDDNIPPECIVRVITMSGHTLYKDDYLSSKAPGGRPARIQVGSALARSHIFVDVRKRLTCWEAIQVHRMLVKETMPS